MTVEVSKLANEIDFSDWLSVVAITLSFATFFYTALWKRSTLIVRLNISSKSFDIGLGRKVVSNLAGEQPEQRVRYRVSFDVVAFMDGNSSMFLDSVIIHPKVQPDNKEELKFWRRCEFKKQLAANSVTSHHVIISPELLNQCPMLISDPNNEVQRELIFSAVVYTPDGHPNEIKVPVLVTIDTKGGAIKVDAKPAKLKYHSFQLVRWFKRKTTSK